MNLSLNRKYLFLYSILLFCSCQLLEAQEQTLAGSNCSDMKEMVDSVFKSNLGSKGILVSMIQGDGKKCTAAAGIATEGTTLTADHTK